MGLRIRVDGRELPRGWSERFYAIRIGTDGSNDIVVAENTPGVHERHCTIVHTGSTYRLEMLPSHLVFVDGERGECGQQLFLRNTERCTLSIGGAPPARSAQANRSLAPPPQITLERIGEKTEAAALRPDHKGPKTNFDLSGFARISIRNLTAAVFVLMVGVGGAFGFSLWSNDQLRHRLEGLASMSDSLPSSDTAREKQKAVFQIGLDGTGGFVASGTAWAWQGPDGLRLVTNNHVVRAINNCAMSASTEAVEKCQGASQGCPAVRYFANQKFEVLHLVACESGKGSVLPARVHADYAEFDRWTRQTGQGAGFPNIYDVAIIDWEVNLPNWSGEGLKLAPALESTDARPKPGVGVAILGYPAEGGDPTAENAASALYRPGWIGRTSDPFGLPSEQEEDYVVISGPEVVGGESGSPIINAAGEVVAITFAGFFQEDAAKNRISYGGRMRALSARLLGENHRFVRGDSTEPSQPSDQRMKVWRTGLAHQAGDRRTQLLNRLGAWPCPAGYNRTQNVQTVAAKADQHARFVENSRAPIDGWSHSADFDLAGAAGDTAHIFMIARSTDEIPRQVLLNYRSGTYSEFASSDPTSTLASVEAPVAFSGQQTLRKGSYVVFTPDDVGKNANFELEIYRIDCKAAGMT